MYVKVLDHFTWLAIFYLGEVGVQIKYPPLSVTSRRRTSYKKGASSDLLYIWENPGGRVMHNNGRMSC